MTEEAAASVGREVQSRVLPPPSKQRKTLDLQRARIEAWPGGDEPLRLVRVHELLGREAIVVGYTTLRRYVRVYLSS